jgi:broad specificity phosphatase PhoE
MKLLIVRHAESQGNATGNYSSLTSDSLSPKGEEQARALAERLAQLRIDRIVVSPRLRTLQTIAPYLESANRQGEIWPETAEACWHEQREEASSSWRSQPSPLPDELAPHFIYRDNNPVKPAHPECFGEGLLRVHETVQLLRALGDQDITLLMVTHGHFIRELLNLILDTPELTAFTHDNTGMTSLTLGDSWRLDSLNQLALFP